MLVFSAQRAKISGRPAIHDFWSNMIVSANAKTAVLTSIHVLPTSDGAVEIGSATLTVEPQGQPASEVELKYVVYLAERRRRLEMADRHLELELLMAHRLS